MSELEKDVVQESELVHEVLQRCARRRIMPVIDEVCIEYGVTNREIAGRQRSKLFNAARAYLWYRLYQTGSFSYPDIGWIFMRDHTSIINGVAKHRKRPRAELHPECTSPCLEASCA